MDTRSKSYSHSVATKIIVFALVIICFTGTLVESLNMLSGDHEIFREKSYFESNRFMKDSSDIIGLLANRTVKINNVSAGQTAGEDVDDNVFSKRMSAYDEVVYYASYNGTVTTNTNKGANGRYFHSFPAYILADGLASGDMVDIETFPREINESNVHYRLVDAVSKLQGTDGKIYVAFTDNFLKPRMAEWKKEKAGATKRARLLLAFIIGLMASFIYLVTVTGKVSFNDKEIHLSGMDGMYNDIKILLCIGLIAIWFILGEGFNFTSEALVPEIVFISVPGLMLVLSLTRHIKKGTFYRHSLIYALCNRVYVVIKKSLDSGDTGRKVTLAIIIGILIYTLLIHATRSFFPVVMAVGLWFVLKKANDFVTIRTGTEKIRNGELEYKIETDDEGELKKLADDINSMAEGLNSAVEDAVKSERLKTELITNVSHDIRTPLTSIITYVDLLKNDKDKSKAEGYIDIIEQKAQRLKVLTDELFDASKAASGDLPVNYEKINIAALMKQGLGEINDRIEESGLDFRLNIPDDNLYIKADGNLMWRAIENLLSNIFKYALAGSRVYLDITEWGDNVCLVLKNVSAAELNISPDELMERFTRGDESRSTQGSGLGLSIAKSLVEIQGGSFKIEIDGDLFKAIIIMPKDQDAE